MLPINRLILTATTQVRCTLERYFSKRAGRHGHRQALVLPVTVSFEEAKAKFLRFHRSNVLSPSDVLGGHDEHSIRLSYLPFYTFHTNLSIEFSAKVGKKDTENGPITWSNTTTYHEHIISDHWNPVSQVYAAYWDRRDLAEGLKHTIADLSHAFKPLVRGGLDPLNPHSQYHGLVAKAGQADNIQVQAIEMRPAIAWELHFRALRHSEEKKAVNMLRKLYKADEIKDFRMLVHVNDRRTRTLYVPAYIITYAYGVHQHGTLEILQQNHQALVPGAGNSPIVSELHFSPLKSQACTATAAVAGSALYGALTGVRSLGDLSAHLLSVDTAFYSFLAACAAGVAARGFTGYVRDRHTGELDAQTMELSIKFLQGSETSKKNGLGDQAWLRSDAEWMRWEEVDKWTWDHDKRKAWAERLIEEHHARRLRKYRAARMAEREEAMYRAYAEQEAARQAKYGRSKRSHNMFAGGKAAAGRFDFKGYYKLMGLDAKRDAVISVANIKSAYRKTAMRMHPDRMRHLNDQEQARASHKFQELQKAYDVLKDPEKRKLYDAGTLASKL